MSKAELYLNSEKAMLAQYILSIDNKETLDAVKQRLYGFVQFNVEEAAEGKADEDLYSCFHGSWGEGKSAEAYSEELREGITAPKEIEAW